MDEKLDFGGHWTKPIHADWEPQQWFIQPGQQRENVSHHLNFILGDFTGEDNELRVIGFKTEKSWKKEKHQPSKLAISAFGFTQAIQDCQIRIWQSKIQFRKLCFFEMLQKRVCRCQSYLHHTPADKYTFAGCLHNLDMEQNSSRLNYGWWVGKKWPEELRRYAPTKV